ncbi:hypothetical protein QE390_002702 [Siphonobacter sp. SORGH_AS 1065]|nr:hypothetical protein [Siphonobacter sp. SORGH_AS_1065]
MSYAVSDLQSETYLSRICDPLIGIANPKEHK